MPKPPQRPVDTFEEFGESVTGASVHSKVCVCVCVRVCMQGVFSLDSWGVGEGAGVEGVQGVGAGPGSSALPPGRPRGARRASRRAGDAR